MKRYKRIEEAYNPNKLEDSLHLLMRKNVEGWGGPGIVDALQYATVLQFMLKFIKNELYDAIYDSENVFNNPEEVSDLEMNLLKKLDIVLRIK
jgi:hypothetical protein